MERNIRPRFGPKQNGFRRHLVSGHINGHLDRWFPGERPHKGSSYVDVLMSALPLKADMCGARAHVRFGPKADIDLSFNHLISASGSKAANSI
jgi:hypothetical protein